ncbi:MAG: adenylyltransferase/cytidyltransferase family protein [Pontiellaceae bacterium]
MKKVMVSGCYDLLHSGHIVFFESASKYGQLYVCIGSDLNIYNLKNHNPRFNEKERLYMVQSLKYVHKAMISSGEGFLDFKEEFEVIKPDIFIVNEDGDRPDKRELCNRNNVEYIVLSRTPKDGLPARSSSALKEDDILPFRLCLAGGWMDQPFINTYEPGSVVTIQIDPREDLINRAGLATSTRRTWEQLIKYNPQVEDCHELAKLLFGYENLPGKKYISGSQDAIGLTHPGINRLDYDSSFWPKNIQTCLDNKICSWLEEHLVLVKIGPREDSYDPLLQQNITREGVQKLSMIGQSCYDAIIRMDLPALGKSFTNNHDITREILPLTTNTKIDNILNSYNTKCFGRTTTGCGGGYVILATDQHIDKGFKVSIRR